MNSIFLEKRIVLLALLLLVSAGCAPSSPAATSPSSETGDPTKPPVCLQEGCLAPDFSLVSTDGGSIELYQLEGHPVILNFWATWCGYCKQEMPDLQSIYAAYQQNGLLVLGIDKAETSTTVAEYLRANALTFPALLDTDGRVGETYHVTGLPTSYFLDGEGVIRSIYIGMMTKDQMTEAVKALFTPVEATSPSESGETPSHTEASLKGCVNIASLNVRAGPGTGYKVISGLVKGDCRQFDARSSDNAWLRLSADQPGPQGGRMWVAVKYIDLEGDIQMLPVAEQ